MRLTNSRNGHQIGVICRMPIYCRVSVIEANDVAEDIAMAGGLFSESITHNCWQMIAMASHALWTINYPQIALPNFQLFCYLWCRKVSWLGLLACLDCVPLAPQKFTTTQRASRVKWRVTDNRINRIFPASLIYRKTMKRIQIIHA